MSWLGEAQVTVLVLGCLLVLFFRAFRVLMMLLCFELFVFVVFLSFLVFSSSFMHPGLLFLVVGAGEATVGLSILVFLVRSGVRERLSGISFQECGV